MLPIKVIAVFGTRPEAIKLAPIIKLLRADSENFNCTVAVTAQHRAMLDQMLEVFRIKPDVDLDIMEENQSLFQVTQKTISRMEGVLQRFTPDVVLVQGDTTSTFVGALAAYYAKIKVAHVEAGLRTHQKYNPFPEEINRRLTSVLTDLHFTPTKLSKTNLVKEGINPESIFITGNTAVDAVLSIKSDDFRFDEKLLNELIEKPRRTIVVTAHRRENWGPAFENIAQAILQLASDYTDVQFVFPIHLNPNVRKTFQAKLRDHAQVHLVEPLNYRSFINLLNRSYFILTDSGGIQEEAPTLRKPVLVMRETTERPEGLAGGCLKLVGCSVERIIAESRRLLDDVNYYESLIHGKNPYGDGRAAERIRDALKFFFGACKHRPEDFAE